MINELEKQYKNFPVLESARITHRTMIARLSVRLEGADFFRSCIHANVAGDRFGDGEFFLARMKRSGIRSLKFKIRVLKSDLRLDFVEPLIDFVETGPQCRKIVLLFIAILQKKRDAFGQFLSVFVHYAYNSSGSKSM